MALVIGTDNDETIDAADGVTDLADTILGLDGWDTIHGLGGDDYIFGGDGNDHLYGDSGKDNLYGGDHDDYLAGGAGGDVIDGGDGNDEASYRDSNAAVRISLIAGFASGGHAEGDTLRNIENLAGSNYDDWLEGNAGTMYLVGGDGDDTLIGGVGANTLYGGDDNDTLIGGASGDTLDGGDGIDTVSYEHSSAAVEVSLLADYAVGGDAEDDELDNIENLVGSAYGDVLMGDDGANVLTGLAGDNTLIGYDGADGLIGGNDSDELFGMDGTDILKGAGGADTLDGGANGDTMLGGSGDDIYFVEDAADVVTENANEGIDTVNAAISYTLGADVENLTLLGGAVNGTGNGRDNIIGNELDNVLRGRGGADTLDGGDGADTMIGGIGNDTYKVDDAGDGVTELAGEGIDTVLAKISYTLGAQVENLTLLSGFGADNGIGNGLRNTITGNELDNVLSGRGGIDTLIGGEGADTLDGGSDADTMIGGGGFDNYVVDNAADVVTEGIDEGFDQVQAGIDYRLAAGTEIEVLYATTDGTDPISLTGNEFDNVVVGNDGDNVIAGGGGQDTLYGHAGSDRFVWTSTDETVLAGQDADVIMDFSRADGDVIDVSQIDADAGGGTANDAFTFVGVVDVSAGASFTAPGQIGYFTADTDGDGAADQTYILLNTETDAGIDYQDATIRIAGAHTVDASWFAL